MDPYAQLGVSSSKEGVHKAIKNLSKGLFPGAFCKILPMPDSLPEFFDGEFVQVIHSDGAGTKSNLVYLMKREGNSRYLEYLKRLPQDVVVMNIDDMAAVGIVNDIQISNHISRNSNRISDEDVATIISGYADFFEKMKKLGVNIIEAGGETADVGSYTTTMGLDATTVGFIEKYKVIDCSNIIPGNVIVGLSSAGQTTYEDRYNSGIRSNGLTLAINVLLSPYYRKYTEVIDGTLDINNVFRGKYMLDYIGAIPGTEVTIADLLLSPTRTYTPVLNEIFGNVKINGIIHCSGGGLTKCIGFGNPDYNLYYIKDILPPIPPIFKLIQQSENIDYSHMYKTFNMGVGMELYVDTIEDGNKIIDVCAQYNLDAKIIGHVAGEKNDNAVRENMVIITNPSQTGQPVKTYQYSKKF